MHTDIRRLALLPVFALFLTPALVEQSRAQTRPEQQSFDPAEADASQSMVELAIDIRETQKHLKETAGLTQSACLRWISEQALAVWPKSTPVEITSGDQKTEMPWIKVTPTELIVRGPRLAVGQLSKLFSELLTDGLPLVQTRLKTYKTTEAAVESLGVRWSLIHLESQVSDETSSTDSSSVLPASAVATGNRIEDQRVTLAGLYANRNVPGLADSLDSQLNTTLEPAGSVPVATTTTELGTAMMYSVLAPDEYQEILEAMSDDRRFQNGTQREAQNFAGLPVQLIDMTQRPLVTGVRSRVVDTGTDGQTKVVLLPQSRVYSVGHRFVLRPTLQNDSQLELTYRADVKDLLRIREVQTSLTVEGNVKSVRVQVPTATHHQVAGKISVPTGYTLAIWISGDEAHTQPEGEPAAGRSTLLLCTCNIAGKPR
ncbi:MAG TPA: hypothetical protein DDW52_22185 [Planctomycetaceae bacterium]|nr:hypothetical protein [Planctomycetaceae bacterium]